jgi:hypothetical protein
MINKFNIFLCLNAFIISSASLGMDVNNNNNGAIDPTAAGELLCKAAQEGDLKLIEDLLDAGVPVDGKSKNITPLRLAIIYGNRKTCALLIANGANLHLVNGLGETPLQLAAQMAWIDFRIEICHQIIDALLKSIKQNQSAAIALLAIKKFNKALCMNPIDRNVIQAIARHVYNSGITAKLFAQIDAVPKQETKEELLDYIQKQRSPKVSKPNSGCTIA